MMVAVALAAPKPEPKPLVSTIAYAPSATYVETPTAYAPAPLLSAYAPYNTYYTSPYAYTAPLGYTGLSYRTYF